MNRSGKKPRKFHDKSCGCYIQPQNRNLFDDYVQLTEIRTRPTVTGKFQKWVSTVKMLSARENNFTRNSKFSRADARHLLSRYLPVNKHYLVDQNENAPFLCEFSSDGSWLVVGYQGSKIVVYDVDNEWKVHEEIEARGVEMSISDISLSPCKQFLAYSTHSAYVHVVDMRPSFDTDFLEVLDVSRWSFHSEDENDFIIFAVNFSSDGQEIVCSSNDNDCNDSIYIRDLFTNGLVLRIVAHQGHIHAVCFADETGNIIYTGSDDFSCKVWDRRLNTYYRPIGIMNGHVEGVTSIDSRGDGRYFISNAKDQTIKLWDIRMMSTSYEGDDNSVATYNRREINLRGDLCPRIIRCYFSPEYSTGQRYIYTGSNDGSVYIYDSVNGELVSKMENHSDIVGDCCWHPFDPTMITCSWDNTVRRSEI